MTTPTDRTRWEAGNAEFLAASLRWLRLVLQRQSPPPPARPTGTERRGGWARICGGSGEPAPETHAVSDADVADAAAAVAEHEGLEPPPALVELSARLGLSRFERDILLLCTAIELDPATARLCATAHGNDQMRYPTFGLALAMLPDPAWDAVSPQSGLRYWRLVEVAQRPGEGLISAALRADERIVNCIKGLNHLDDRLTPLLTVLESSAAQDLPPSQRQVADRLEREWMFSPMGAPTVQLVGPDPSGKRLVTAYTAQRCDLQAFVLPAALIPQQPNDLDNLARLWQRESALLPLALYLDAEEVDGPEGTRAAVTRFLSRIGGRAALAVRDSWADVGRPSVELDVAPPTPAERAVAWRSVLPADSTDVDALATQFALEVGQIHEIASTAAGSDDLWQESRDRTRPRMDALAQRLAPRVGWDDIVLVDPARALLEQVADQVAHRTTVYEEWGFGARADRGLGVSVLFAGPSGTGKTMAAEVLATRLRLDLYRIDLSGVVSKYIGETEKNLRKLFDAAEGGGAVLFFDEADALFGKRSQVKDAHDRYANIEVNYLLQRMEEYHGLAILATNMRAALDTAFLRRLRFIVEFPFPDVAERRSIWQKSFPATCPVDSLDLDRLAQIQATGGMVRNIAVNAAFLAATAGEPVSMTHVMRAARTEFEKLELPVREREFSVAPVRVGAR